MRRLERLALWRRSIERSELARLTQIAFLRGRGTQRLVATVLAENEAMLGLADKLGFVQPDEQPEARAAAPTRYRPRDVRVSRATAARRDAMHLEGSCHCGSVKFSVESESPVPFMRCYCSICRKTAGGGGFAVNLGATTSTMKVRGKRHLRIYRARLPNERGAGTHASSARRYFCARCGSALWLWDPTWPELVHPHASAIDTPLPTPPEHVHCLVGSKAPWVEVEGRPGDPRFDHYPDMSLAQWHEAQGLKGTRACGA